MKKIEHLKYEDSSGCYSGNDIYFSRAIQRLEDKVAELINYINDKESYEKEKLN